MKSTQWLCSHTRRNVTLVALMVRQQNIYGGKMSESTSLYPEGDSYIINSNNYVERHTSVAELTLLLRKPVKAATWQEKQGRAQLSRRGTAWSTLVVSGLREDNKQEETRIEVVYSRILMWCLRNQAQENRKDELGMGLLSSQKKGNFILFIQSSIAVTR